MASALLESAAFPSSEAMDEVGDSTQQSQSPVKTEWNSRCVIFTYFQGDISKEVDEHFSRALGLSVSSLQELSPSNHHRRESQQQEEVILTNEMDLAPNQWRFSSPWTKPHPEANFGNGDTNGSVDIFEPVAVNPYPITTTRSPLSQPDQPWQSPTLPYSNSLDLTYPSAFSVPEALVPVPEPQQEEKCESLISFLQQDRSIALPQQPVSSISWEDGYMAHTAGGSGLHFNLPPSSSSAQHIDVCGNMQKNCAVSTVGWNTDGSSQHHPNITTLYNLNPTQPLFDKKIYFSPVCETISTGYADEKSQIPETSKDFYY